MNLIIAPIGRERKIAVEKGRPSTCHLIIGRQVALPPNSTIFPNFVFLEH